MRNDTKAFVLVAVLVQPIGVACNKRPSVEKVPPASSRVIETTDEKGWAVYEIASEGFSLALPPGWLRIEMDPKEFETKFHEAVERNPHIQAMIGDLRQQAASGVKFYGLDPASIRDDRATQVNVVRLPVPPGYDLDEEVARTVQKLEAKQEVEKPIVQQRIELPTGEVVRLDYKMMVKSEDDSRTQLAIAQFIIHRVDNLYVMTVGTFPDLAQSNASTIEGIGRSFRITK